MLRNQLGEGQTHGCWADFAFWVLLLVAVRVLGSRVPRNVGVSALYEQTSDRLSGH